MLFLEMLLSAHNRSFQIPSSRIDTRKISFFPRTVRDWNILAPDIVEMDTPEAFKAVTTVYSFNCKFNYIIIYYHLIETDLNFGHTIHWACRTKIKIA